MRTATITVPILVECPHCHTLRSLYDAAEGLACWACGWVSYDSRAHIGAATATVTSGAARARERRIGEEVTRC